jgi:hypothetical protein
MRHPDEGRLDVYMFRPEGRRQRREGERDQARRRALEV